MDGRCYFIAMTWRERPVSRQFRALADGLVEHGHRVVTLLDRQRSDLEDHDGNPSVYAWPSSRPVTLRDARFFAGLVRQYRPDCIIANGGAVNVMLVVGWMMGVPLRVTWYHTVSSASDIDGQVSPWKLRLLRLRKRLVYRLATHIVPVSEAARDDVQRVFGIPAKKCQVFHSSLDDPFEQVDGLDQGARSTNRFVCVGRLVPTKGQDVLIRAVAHLQQSSPDVCVEFIGSGPSQSPYEQLARDLRVEDRCIFVGALRHDEVLRRMASATATVLPSRDDAFPLVNLESLAVGTPVVASRVGGIVEAIRDGVDGFLVPPGDPGSLARKLELLLSDNGLRETMRRNARERFLTCFARKRNIATQVQWFEDAVTGLSSLAEHWPPTPG